MHNADQRLRACEQEIRRLRGVLLLISMLGVALVFGNCAVALQGSATDVVGAATIRTSELIIEDKDGTVRVRVGAGLPDAVIDGRTVDRGSEIAGILLYDSEGQERSGYVTEDESGNVLLTLDSRVRQTALFVADTSGATALRIWNNSNAVDLRADSDGARVTVVRDGSVVFQEPHFADPAATSLCRVYQTYKGQVSSEELIAACRQRMPDDACDLCLSGQ